MVDGGVVVIWLLLVLRTEVFVRRKLYLSLAAGAKRS